MSNAEYIKIATNWQKRFAEWMNGYCPYCGWAEINKEEIRTKRNVFRGYRFTCLSHKCGAVGKFTGPKVKKP